MKTFILLCVLLCGACEKFTPPPYTITDTHHECASDAGKCVLVQEVLAGNYK